MDRINRINRIASIIEEGESDFDSLTAVLLATKIVDEFDSSRAEREAQSEQGACPHANGGEVTAEGFVCDDCGNFLPNGSVVAGEVDNSPPGSSVVPSASWT